MITSFSTALSALNAQSTAIDVVGNNLANLNTPGFKTSVVAFHDLVTQSLGSGSGDTQTGFGVGRPITLRVFSQGAIQTTAAPLDAAIEGDGFFIVKDPTGATLYTRGGNLEVDQNGYLTTATGDKLQGWSINNLGKVDTNATIANITIPVGTLKAPVETKQMSFDFNLNAAAPTGDTFSSSIEVFDSLGSSHVVKIDFTRNSAANTWDYSISVPDADLTSAFTPVTGTLTFDGAGKLTSPSATDPAPVVPIAGLVDGAVDMSITWNLYNGLTPRVTQYSQTSAISADAQDGSPAANLKGVIMGNGGKILAQYSNGQQVVVGQLAMAVVRNPVSLIAAGNNNYGLSAQTAQPAIGLPNTGGRGNVVGSAVEASTVDIAKEFTNLIVLQRSYQANARVVTAVDEISQETLNLKH
jgi:flagellar hook protein FlgE